MEHYLSLLLFTFTGQTAIGLILIRPLMNTSLSWPKAGLDIVTPSIGETGSHPASAAGQGQMKGVAHKTISVRYDHMVSVLLLVALATAFFHLGSPLRAVYALNNIGNSPLSMEIASLSFLMAISLVISWFSFKNRNGNFRKLLIYFSVVGALLLLLTMTSVYVLPSVPSWFSLNTPLAFVLTTVSAASAVAAIMLFNVSSSLAVRMMVVAVSSTVIMLIANILAGKLFSDGIMVLPTIYVLSVIAAFILIMSIILRPGMNKSYRMTVITCMVVLLSGIIARLLFFLSYDNTIL